MVTPRYRTLFAPRLENPRDHDKALALVFVTEFFAVTALLLGSPDSHLSAAHSNEEQDTPAQATDQVDASPREDLKQVVRASDQTKSKARWDTPLGGTRATKVAQDQVGVQVGQLRKDEETQACIQEILVWGVSCRSRIRTEGPVGDVEACQEPVVSTVLEDVAGRHGGIAEAVDEDRFELAFQEVGAQKCADQKLGVGGVRERLIEVIVDVRPQREEEEGGDQERAEIFNDEHGPPSDLRACAKKERLLEKALESIGSKLGISRT